MEVGGEKGVRGMGEGGGGKGIGGGGRGRWKEGKKVKKRGGGVIGGVRMIQKVLMLERYNKKCYAGKS